MSEKLRTRLLLYSKYITAWQVAKAFSKKKDAWLMNPQNEYMMVKYSIFTNTVYIMRTQDILQCNRECKNKTQMFIRLNKTIQRTTLADYQILTGKTKELIDFEKMLCVTPSF